MAVGAMTPIVWVYATAQMDSQCPNCHAAPSDYCRRPDGHVRAIPCIARMREGTSTLSVSEQLPVLGDERTA